METLRLHNNTTPLTTELKGTRDYIYSGTSTRTLVNRLDSSFQLSILMDYILCSLAAPRLRHPGVPLTHLHKVDSSEQVADAVYHTATFLFPSPALKLSRNLLGKESSSQD